MSKSSRVSIFESPVAETKVEATPVIPAEPKANLTKRMVCYLPMEAFEILREAAHHERCSFNDLFLEGIDHVLKVRSHPSTATLKAQRDK